MTCGTANCTYRNLVAQFLKSISVDVIFENLVLHIIILKLFISTQLQFLVIVIMKLGSQKNDTI